jgi:hypothetical protein
MAKQAKTEVTKKYVPKTTTKIGDVVGKAYDLNDSLVGEVTKTKTGFKFTGKKTGKSVECTDIRRLVDVEYLKVTGGEKFAHIRWARTKNFDIMDYSKPCTDKKPHWQSDNFPNKA